MRVRRRLDDWRKTHVEAPSPRHLRSEGTSDDGTNNARDAENSPSYASESGALLKSCYLAQDRHHCYEDGTSPCSLNSPSSDKSVHIWCEGTDQASDFKEGDHGYGDVF